MLASSQLVLLSSSSSINPHSFDQIIVSHSLRHQLSIPSQHYQPTQILSKPHINLPIFKMQFNVLALFAAAAAVASAQS
jgi:hypothetical protein